MQDLTNERKLEHIKAIDTDAAIERDGRYFDRDRLLHRALPEIDMAEVDPSVVFMGKRLSFPLVISSMTGGDHALVRDINYRLAEAAEQEQVAMGVGSQRVMLDNPAARASFDLRAKAPTSLLFANLGAVQLNYGVGVEQVREAVDCLAADALYLHLNPLQEAVQPEGDTNFANLGQKIRDLVQALDCPVILKEVGAGLSPADIQLGLDAGIKYFDLAGTGGTSWSRIENHRRQDNSNIGRVFQDWGLPTPLALQLAKQRFAEQGIFIASGGIRDGIDMVKSVIMGAFLCGLAAPFLKAAMQSTEAVVETIRKLRQEFMTAMFLLGARRFADIYQNNDLILGEF